MNPEMSYAIKYGAIVSVIWLVIGLIQRSLQGVELPAAFLAELPSTVLIFGLSVAYINWRRSRYK